MIVEGGEVKVGLEEADHVAAGAAERGNLRRTYGIHTQDTQTHRHRHRRRHTHT